MSEVLNTSTTNGQNQTQRTAEEIGIELVLSTTKALYISRKTILPSTFEKAKSHGGVILARTSKHEHVRNALGHSEQMWKHMNTVFTYAIPVLEVQSIALDDAATGTTGCCSNLMISNYETLTSDLIRLNDLLLIARNCLATTPKAQNLAGDSLLDQQVLKLIDLCVRVTARGYDGEAGGAGTKPEKLWSSIIGLYKHVLVSCLQFLHNFIIQNEQRKLLLWLDLFANSRLANDYVTGAPTSGREQMRDMFEAKLAEVQNTAKENGHTQADGSSPKLAVENANLQESAKGPEHNEALKSISQSDILKEKGDKDGQRPSEVRQNTSSSAKGPPKNRSEDFVGGSDQEEVSDSPEEIALESLKNNFGPLRSPESAAVTLKAAKDQLMARLKESAKNMSDVDRAAARAAFKELSDADQASTRTALDQGDLSEEGALFEEEDDEYRDQGELGDQARGLLTDIPLVLGYQEIEALPMIIQIAICPGLGSVLHGRDMQSLRCNILLAGEAGRNLLRELLIFIAAWDLQDDTVYFTLMRQIMEAVLENGLMPYAYQTFAEVKDIVSPAQSMVIKILTQIFRGRHGMTMDKAKGKELYNNQESPHGDATRRVDIYIVRYIFTMFRSSIIPETCALIYLQGQIKAGAALPEDFPLNLWDMERVYEGVYQFLEFFAVLTENEPWKNHLVEWEIVSELVTLLRELDASIPKAPLAPISQSLEEQQGPILQKERSLAEAYANVTQNDPNIDLNTREAKQPDTNTPVLAVERPWSPETSDATASKNKTSSAYAAGIDRAIPASPGSKAPANRNGSEGEPDAASIDSEDPAEFEWRNLKKLVILVLSSLVWKSPIVQTQIRQYGGVELVLGCCNYDGHNPYIREHAVMCLRFLLEGSKENQDIVSERITRIEGLGGVLGEDLAGEVLGLREDIHGEEEVQVDGKQGRREVGVGET